MEGLKLRLMPTSQLLPWAGAVSKRFVANMEAARPSSPAGFKSAPVLQGCRTKHQRPTAVHRPGYRQWRGDVDVAGAKTMRDGDYLSARWPGDAHRFAAELAAMIG
jgi:hypothetical protein